MGIASIMLTNNKTLSVITEKNPNHSCGTSSNSIFHAYQRLCDTVVFRDIILLKINIHCILNKYQIIHISHLDEITILEI